MFTILDVIYKALVLGVPGCGFSSNIGFSDVTDPCLCLSLVVYCFEKQQTTILTMLTFPFFHQNHCYASAERRSGQVSSLKVYLGKKEGGEKEGERKKSVFKAKSVCCKLTVWVYRHLCQHS